MTEMFSGTCQNGGSIHVTNRQSIRRAAGAFAGSLAFLAAAAVCPTASAAAVTPDAAIPIKAAHSNKCLNVQGAVANNSVKLIQYTCSPTFVNDKFRIVPKGTAGTYQIIANFSGKCLNVPNNATANDVQIIQYTCVDTAANNLWKFVAVAGKPTFRIVSALNGKCLNISKASLENSAALIQYTCSTATTTLNDQFYFPPATAASTTALPITARTPVLAVQGGTTAPIGPLVYAFTDNGGRVWRAYQPDPDIATSIQWSPVPGLEQFAGHPVVSVQADGRVQISARNTADGDLWLSTQVTKGQPDFGAWQDVAGSSTFQPAVGKRPDGKLVTFAIVGGNLWHLPQDGTSLPYGAWRLIGNGPLVGEPTVVTIRDGLRIFALNPSGALLTALYRNGTLSDWTSLGGAGLTGTPAAVVLPGYLTRVVVRTADGLLATKAEKADGTFDADWSTVGDFVSAGSPAAVMDPLSGATAIVARGDDNKVHYTSETEQSSGVWRAWTTPIDRVIDTDPTVVAFNREGGPAWGYTVRDANFQPYLVTKNDIGSTALRASAGSTASSTFTDHALPAPPVG
jgi:hypothetical protein